MSGIGEKIQYIDALEAELVALQTEDGDVLWMEVRFGNSSHAEPVSHRREKAYSPHEEVFARFRVPSAVSSCVVIDDSATVVI